MSEPQTVYVPVDKIGVRRRATASIAVIGNPNSGKSTLFNALLGHERALTAPEPGTTATRDTCRSPAPETRSPASPSRSPASLPRSSSVPDQEPIRPMNPVFETTSYTSKAGSS